MHTIFRDCGCGCLQETESFSSVRNTPIDTQGTVRKTLLLVERVHAEVQQVGDQRVRALGFYSNARDSVISLLAAVRPDRLLQLACFKRIRANGEGVCSFTHQSSETVAGTLSHYKGLPGLERGRNICIKSLIR